MRAAIRCRLCVRRASARPFDGLNYMTVVGPSRRNELPLDGDDSLAIQHNNLLAGD